MHQMATLHSWFACELPSLCAYRNLLQDMAVGTEVCTDLFVEAAAAVPSPTPPPPTAAAAAAAVGAFPRTTTEDFSWI